MPSCPQCTKPLAELTRHCPSCKADLDLLVDYVRQLGGGLKRAELLRYKHPVAIELMRSIKQAIDPNGIMNPGKVL